MSLKAWTHPLVIAEYDLKVEDAPGICHYPYGAVHKTALKPNPHWCVKHQGHSGPHMDEDALERERDRKAQNKRDSRRSSDNGS